MRLFVKWIYLNSTKSSGTNGSTWSGAYKKLQNWFLLQPQNINHWQAANKALKRFVQTETIFKTHLSCWFSKSLTLCNVKTHSETIPDTKMEKMSSHKKVPIHGWVSCWVYFERRRDLKSKQGNICKLLKHSGACWSRWNWSCLYNVSDPFWESARIKSDKSGYQESKTELQIINLKELISIQFESNHMLRIQSLLIKF